jgi:hypothetical protein
MNPTPEQVAALTEALTVAWPSHLEGSSSYPSSGQDRTWRVLDPALPSEGLAAAILGERGVFLPEGHGPVMVGMAEEIARLRAWVTNRKTRDKTRRDRYREAHPEVHRKSARESMARLRAHRAALAEAREVTNAPHA